MRRCLHSTPPPRHDAPRCATPRHRQPYPAASHCNELSVSYFAPGFVYDITSLPSIEHPRTIHIHIHRDRSLRTACTLQQVQGGGAPHPHTLSILCIEVAALLATFVAP